MSDAQNFLIAHIGHTNRHHEHVVWWRPDSCGYTICIDKAGRYTDEEAASICAPGICIAVPEKDAEPLARSTPYYRMNNGTLGTLYDGGPHRPVPNSRGCWDALLRFRAYPNQKDKTEKPTPIGAKARAIYIDGIVPKEPT